MRFHFVLILLFVFSIFNVRAEKKSMLKLQTNTINFGIVKYKDPVPVKNLIIKNTGKENLVILRTYTDCSCTIIDNKIDTIAPGRSDTLKIKFKAKKLYPGVYTKKIYIKSNSVSKIDTIVVHAEVRHN